MTFRLYDTLLSFFEPLYSSVRRRNNEQPPSGRCEDKQGNPVPAEPRTGDQREPGLQGPGVSDGWWSCLFFTMGSPLTNPILDSTAGTVLILVLQSPITMRCHLSRTGFDQMYDCGQVASPLRSHVLVCGKMINF